MLHLIFWKKSSINELWNIGMKKRILADSFYVKNWSFSMDIVIILKTIFLIIIGDKNAR